MKKYAFIVKKVDRSTNQLEELIFECEAKNKEEAKKLFKKHCGRYIYIPLNYQIKAIKK